MNGEFTIAVHALVFLNHKGVTLSSEALAQNVCTNPARIRKVMAKLKRAGLVCTREGVVGGYSFELEPENVDLDMVAAALDERAVDIPWHSGDSDMECLIASGMAGIMDGIFEDLNALCRKRLASITIKAIDSQIFGAPEA